MSDLSLRVLQALFLKSNVSAVVGSGKLTAIYQGKADTKAVFPYGIIQRVAPGQVSYLFGGNIAKEDDLYLCKVLARNPVAGQSPQLFAETMSNTWVSTIGTSLTLVGGGRVTWCLKFSDMAPIDEPDNEKWIYHRGFLQRVVAEP